VFLSLPLAVSGLSCLSYCLSVCCLSCLGVSRQGLGQQQGKGKGKTHWPWGTGRGGTQGQGRAVEIVEEGRVGEEGKNVAWHLP
jgi:hypothetical protein